MIITARSGSPESVEIQIAAAAFCRAVSSLGLKPVIKKTVKRGIVYIDATVRGGKPDWDRIHTIMQADLGASQGDRALSAMAKEGVKSYWYGKWFDSWKLASGYTGSMHPAA